MLTDVTTTAGSSNDVLIRRFFLSNIFSELAPMAKSDEVADAILEEFVASGKIRSGACPNEESFVVIRNIIQYFVSDGKPIPFIVPWGPKKPPDDASVDIAEYGALLAILNLNQRIKAHYQPGITVRIRVEDLCGFYLLREKGDGLYRTINRYVQDFERLITVLDPNQIIVPVRESTLANVNAYADQADRLVPYFHDYISYTDTAGMENYKEHPSWKVLADQGWKGEILPAQREYYRSRYRAIYPGLPEAKYTLMLSQYLAYSMTRILLKTYGYDNDWNGQFLQINFTSPVPGAPASVGDRKIYYRVYPSPVSKDRTPPWKAKGYLRIKGENVLPVVTSWMENDACEGCTAVLAGQNGNSARLQIDYVTE